MTTTAAKGPRQTAVESVIEAITEGVKDGRYAPGQRLVEADLTAELGISRGSLREALGRLAAEGMLELEPYRGAVVRRLSPEDVQDLFNIREVLEGEAARLAALRIDEGSNRASLEREMAVVDGFRGRNDTMAYMDENERFHELVVELSGSKLLARLIPQLQVHAFRLLFRRMIVEDSAMPNSIDEHAEVAAAILSGDAKAAERAMRVHVRRSGELSVRTAEQTFST
jgi:DNA-binding GntR family transcriptional regulator